MNTTSRKPESVSSVNMTPARAEVAAHHVLHADRERHRAVVEALVHAVGDGAIVEQRGEHLVHRAQHARLAAHVEEGFLLAGEGGLRQVLGGGRGAHRDRDVRPGRHLAELRDHRLLEGRRQRRRHDPLADAGPGRGKLGDVIDVEAGELGADALIEAALLQEVAVRLGGGGKAARHLHAQSRQRADHLAEGGVLAADGLDIVHAQLLERDDECVQGCS